MPKSRSSIWILAMACLCASPIQSIAQEQQAQTPPDKLKVIYYTPHSLPATAKTAAMIKQQALSGQTIPLWTYTTTAYNGTSYSGAMVGRSPFNHGHRTTTIPTYLIPLKITMQDSGKVFDASAADSCAPNGKSVANLILSSPLITPAAFTMNGVNVGTAQYVDAFQRASFWSLVGGTPYHTNFSTTPTVLPAVAISVPTNEGFTDAAASFGGCSDIALVNLDWLDNYVQQTVMPGLAASGVGPLNFPQFILDSVAEYIGSSSNCCVLGYHNSYTNSGGIFQTYSLNEYDTSGGFGGDTSVMSHEIAEWLDDPNGSNPTPAWGAEGQVTAGSCQANLEVGDPLSPGYPTATNPFTVTTGGVSYTLQELAFYSWFLGTTPSLGTGGKYSNNGTFSGHAAACPPGGSL